jgi:sterol desaturase/sphingolipid hydroxylase (fatty acid hydroxylase superfamily)
MFKWVKNEYKARLDHALLWKKDTPKVREEVRKATARWVVGRVAWVSVVGIMALLVMLALAKLGILLYILVPAVILYGIYFFVKRMLNNVDS